MNWELTDRATTAPWRRSDVIRCAIDKMSIKPEELERRARVKAKQREYRRTSSQTARRYPPTRPKPQFCELCRQRPAEALDHCHTRKVFRGWLCNACNMALGNAKDDVQRLRRLADYLEDFAMRQ